MPKECPACGTPVEPCRTVDGRLWYACLHPSCGMEFPADFIVWAAKGVTHAPQND
jgi:hypothetical protein